MQGIRPLRHPHRARMAAQGVLGEQGVLRLAQEQADRRFVMNTLDLVVDRRHVRAELPDEARLEAHGLQLDYNEPVELVVEEQEVEEEVLAGDTEAQLPADEREALPELQEEALDVVDEGLLDLPFAEIPGGPEEVEQVWVLCCLLGQVGIRGRKGLPEVADRPTAALVGLPVDLEFQNRTAPPVLDRLGRVPEPRLMVPQALQEHDLVAPRQLCNSLLHNCRVRPGRRERPHVLQVAGREPLAAGEPFLQVSGQLVDHLGTPADQLLALENLLPDRPVGADDLPICGQDRTRPTCGDLG